MLRYLKYFIMALAAVLLLMFAYANRSWVTVALNPFEPIDDQLFSVPAPLYVVVFFSIMIGVIVGGASTWFSQGRHRRSLRQARSEIDKLRADLQAAKTVPITSLPVARRA